MGEAITAELVYKGMIIAERASRRHNYQEMREDALYGPDLYTKKKLLAGRAGTIIRTEVELDDEGFVQSVLGKRGWTGTFKDEAQILIWQMETDVNEAMLRSRKKNLENKVQQLLYPIRDEYRSLKAGTTRITFLSLILEYITRP